jgi:hypothetical protein
VTAAEVLGKHAPIESLAVLARAFKSERVNDYVASNVVKELVKRFGPEAVRRNIDLIEDAAVRVTLLKAVT